MSFSILRVLARFSIILGAIVVAIGLFSLPRADGLEGAGIIFILLFFGIPFIGAGVLIFIGQRIKSTTTIGKIVKWGFLSVAIFIFFGVVSAWIPERIILQVVEIFPSVSTCRVFQSPIFLIRNMIVGTHASQICFAYVGVYHSDPASCKNLSWDLSDKCYQGIAQKEQDPSFCKHMIAYTGGEKCYGRVAIAADNIEICKAIDIEGSSRHGKCVAQVQRQDCAYKHWGVLPFPDDAGCYSSLAIAKQDVRICENILYSIEKLLCRASFR
jgi:hypothetical protein